MLSLNNQAPVTPGTMTGMNGSTISQMLLRKPSTFLVPLCVSLKFCAGIIQNSRRFSAKWNAAFRKATLDGHWKGILLMSAKVSSCFDLAIKPMTFEVPETFFALCNLEPKVIKILKGYYLNLQVHNLSTFVDEFARRKHENTTDFAWVIWGLGVLTDWYLTQQLSTLFR